MNGTIERKGETFGAGGLVSLIGLLLCLTCYGAIVGIPMMIWGHANSYYPMCSNCGTKLASYKVRICPACGTNFNCIPPILRPVI